VNRTLKRSYMMGLVLKTLGSWAASSFSLRGAGKLVIVKQINLIVFTLSHPFCHFLTYTEIPYQIP
jgi:hypothetical protein